MHTRAPSRFQADVGVFKHHALRRVWGVQPAGRLQKHIRFRFVADRVFRRAAVEWIRDHPGEAATLYLGKLVHWLAASNRLATAGEEGRLRDLVAAVGWYGLLTVALLGLVLAARARRLDRRRPG